MKNYPFLHLLPQETEDFLINMQKKYRFTFQQMKQLADISADYLCWGEPSIQQCWPEQPLQTGSVDSRKIRESVFSEIESDWKKLKDSCKSYSAFRAEPELIAETEAQQRFTVADIAKEQTVMGRCPVASEKTRCCNLQTLDAVLRCGFDCSYCSIQSFYNNGVVEFRSDLKQRLENLELDPSQLYHIGTGQSSDSLMWGNRSGLLDTLTDFANKNPNVILELKSKSANIDYFKDKELPSNILFTWSLNPQIIVDSEEHYTDSLEKRLESAKIMHDKGALVGFHFHPMIWYDTWKEDYSRITEILQRDFSPENVALVSMGTLTFIKPVIKMIRKRQLHSKILQMPLEEIAGKYSYPFDIKEELFSTLYNSFSEDWKKNVFFYMCMEDKRLWQPVFGREYETNEAFEQDMKDSYFKKIKKQ